MRKAILSGAVAMLVAGVAFDAAKPASADRTVRCESREGRTQRCGVDTRGGVYLQRQLSSAGCWQGDTWGYDRRGIWVSNGCRAEFRVGSGGGHHSSHNNDGAAAAAIALGVIAAAAIASHNHDRDDRYDHDGGYYPPAYPQYNYTIDCRSIRYRHVRCPVDVRRGSVEIIRQHSKTQCQYGRNWGYDRNAVWVSDGCQAEFAIYR
jgi:hypothetical protein